jgi:SagB-type dehydrogenase family enzyme
MSNPGERAKEPSAMLLLRLLPDVPAHGGTADGHLRFIGPLRDISWRPPVGASRALDALRAGVAITVNGDMPVLPASIGPSGLALALLRGGQAELHVQLGPGQVARLLSTRPGAGWRAAPAPSGPWRLAADAALEPCGGAAGGAVLGAAGTTVRAEVPAGPWLGALFAPWRAEASGALECALRWAGLAEPVGPAAPGWAAEGWTAADWRFHKLTTDPGPPGQGPSDNSRLELPAAGPTGHGIRLPPAPPETPFSRLLATRRSERHHGAAPLPLAMLAALLHRGLRDLGPLSADTPALRHRPYPSAGARQALDWFVAAGDVAGLGAGLYRYAPAAHAFEPVGAEGPPRDLLAEAAAAWGAPEAPPQALVIATCRMGRLTPRYAGLAYRLALLEAGCALQSLSLAASEAGIAACILGSGSASRFTARSGLAAESAAPIAWLAVGSSAAGSDSIA